MWKRDEKYKVAILLADIHLSHKPPLARSVENWYEKQASYLNQVKTLSKNDSDYTNNYLPILCSGDVFDDGWRMGKCPPELINFAIKNLPKMYAIPGQHDLPHHNYTDIKKSAYWTMVECGLIVNVEPSCSINLHNGINLHGFPWNFPILPNEKKTGLNIEVALIHSYIWKKGYGYTGASEYHRVKAYTEKLEGYDVAVFGDNHIPFEYKLSNQCLVYNCGGFMRRKQDEIHHKPSVGILYNDCTIERHYLDVEEDKFLDFEKLSKNKIGDQKILDFLANIVSLQENVISYEEAINRYLDTQNVSNKIRNIILAALES